MIRAARRAARAFRRRAPARPIAVALAAALAAAPAQAFDPDALPEPLWWRAERPFSLAERPLAAARAPGSLRTTAEWAPLYAGPAGALEGRRSTVDAWGAAGRWRVGLELDDSRGVARGGDRGQRLGAERPGTTRAALALAREGESFAVAGSAIRDRGRGGFAAEGRAALAGRGAATASWSRLPQAGRAAVRWGEERIEAAGGWVDQRVAVTLAFAAGPARIELGQEALDRRPEALAGAAGDALEPLLAWRASRLGIEADLPGGRAALALAGGAGRQGVRLARGGAGFATAGAAVRAALLEARWTFDRHPLAARAWAGHLRGKARGAVALWPFDPVAALAGTRRIGVSSGRLDHQGVALDRVLDGRPGLEGGVALWRLAPSVRYTTWQATLAGLGRDDVSSGAASLRSALALGLRAAAAVRVGSAAARLEVVQWAPLRIERTPRPAPPAPGGPPAAAEPAARERGGTIVRASLLLGALPAD